MYVGNFLMGTSLTIIAIIRASVLVLETRTLYCVCKCIFLNHDDSLCKNVKLPFCVIRFLLVYC